MLGDLKEWKGVGGDTSGLMEENSLELHGIHKRVKGESGTNKDFKGGKGAQRQPQNS